MNLHPNGLAYGTMRRAPAPSFAHAILLDQGDDPACWEVIDLYGPMQGSAMTDEDVADWPTVYTPVEDTEWHAMTFLLRNPPITPQDPKRGLRTDNNYEFMISDVEVDRQAREHGHGRVRPREDGVYAKCRGLQGGCGVCRREAEIFGEPTT